MLKANICSIDPLTWTFEANEAPSLYGCVMKHEQLFEETVDSEQMFVMRCSGIERTFVENGGRPRVNDQGAMHMSVAFELEHEETFRTRPALRLIQGTGHVAPTQLVTPILGNSQVSGHERCRQQDQRAATSSAQSVVRRPSATVIRRRRVALSVVVAAALVALALPISALGGRAVHPALTTAVPVSLSGHQGPYYVVQPGDTLSSIAARIDPSDPSQMAQRLAATTGSRTVVPGEHIHLP